MMPANYPLKLYRGDSYKWQFKLWLDEAKQQPLDLTGVTVKAEIRNKTAGDQIFVIACEVVVPNIVNASLSAEECLKLPIVNNYQWDLQLTYPTGEVNTILAGLVAVTGDVTDSTVAPPAPLDSARILGETVTPIKRAPRIARR
jgi:hypothetical protein